MLNKFFLIVFLLSSNFSLLNTSYAFDFVEVKSNEIGDGLALDLGVMRNFKGSQLCSVAENTKTYINNHSDDTFAVKAGDVFGQKISLDQVKDTLDFICEIYRDDLKAERQSRLHDTDFLEQNFVFYRWMPDVKTAKEIAIKSTNAVKSRMLNNIPDDEIFLTKYYTKTLTASPIRTDEYNQALYALPVDELDLTLEEANKDRTLTRFKYTRQEVIDGALLNR